jgi:hypothetical protein
MYDVDFDALIDTQIELLELQIEQEYDHIDFYLEEEDLTVAFN